MIYHMGRGDINLLIERREEVVDLFIKRCDDYYFQNALRASDKKSVNDRIKILKTVADRVLHKGVLEWHLKNGSIFISMDNEQVYQIRGIISFKPFKGVVVSVLLLPECWSS